MSKDKKPPLIRQGDIVFWMSHPHEEVAHPAMVSEIGVEALNLVILSHEGVGPKDGVRHHLDPVLNDPERNFHLLNECGCYRTKAENDAIADRKRELEEMRAMELEDREKQRHLELARN